MTQGTHGNHSRGASHHEWTSGGSVASNGYVKLNVGKGHPLADPKGYAYAHLVIWCAAGNPRPPKGWVIHHRNHEKTDNRFDNLELKQRGAHKSEHIKSGDARDPATGKFRPPIKG